MNRKTKVDKQKNNPVQNREELFRSLVETVNAIPWEVDLASQRFTYVGSQAEAMLGYPIDDWYKEDFWLKSMHPDDRDWVSSFCKEAVKQQQDRDCEYRMRRKDGRVLWVHDYINIIVEAGVAVALHGFMFEITAQKEKEASLFLSQQRLVESQNIARLGHWDWDVVSGELYWSDEHYHLCGLEPGQITPSYEAFLNFVHPDDRDEWNTIVSAAMEKGIYDMDHRVVLADGEIRYVHGQGRVEFDAGKPVRMMGTIQDITERKHLENALNIISSFNPAAEITEYYRACVEGLVNIYNTQYVFIGLFSDESQQRISTQVVWANGEFVDNFEYDLKGTPCADILNKKKELISENAAKLYSGDALLVDMKVESYFGAPIISSSGETLGLVSVFDTKPMEIEPWAEPILGVFAQRVASQIEHKGDEEKIKASEKELRNIFRDMQDTYYRTDNEGRFVRLSESVKELLGYEVDELLGKKVKDIHVDSRGRLKLLKKLEQLGTANGFDAPLKHKDGSIVWGSSNSHYCRDDDDNIVGVEGMIRDMSQHRESELQMRKMSSALEQSADMIVITDNQGVVEYINPAVETITGYSFKEVVGGTFNIVKSGKQSDDFYKNLWTTILAGEVFRDVLINKKKNGDLYYEEKTITPIKNNQGQIINFVGTGRDITSRMENEERLSFMAHHDALTELPNRILFMDRLSQSLAHATRYAKRVAVLFVDLDRFKNINDTLGHDVGDKILIQLASRLRKNIRRGDTVARLGGDEFAILLNDIETEQVVSQLTKMVLLALEQPLEVEGREFFVTASIGISLFPNDGSESGTLLRNADIAMYKAKDMGKNNYQFYSADMSARAFQRLTMENSLRRALEREEFILFYQPQFNLKTNKISGVEALLRWQHPDLGMVMPNDFIPLLEETGLINQVGDWIVGEACRQMKVWSASGFSDLMMSVNISGRQFHDKGFIGKIEACISASGVSPNMIEMEITESVLMENQERTVTALELLEKMGFRIAIDDFGTGYSSFGYLRRFRVDTLKVDQSFIHDVIENADDAAITSAIIAMAHSLKLNVIAEGVETQQQLAFLRKHDCDCVQGYLLSRPLPADELTKLLLSQE